MARDLGISVAQFLGKEEAPKAELAWKYEHGKPLVRPEQVPHLPTQLRRLHEWYMQASEEGTIMLMVSVKDEHYFRGQDEICIMFEELFQLYNQDALDKSIVSCYCLMKILECKRGQIYDIGFIDPNTVHEVTVKQHAKDTEDNLLRFLKKQSFKMEILFPYNFQFHFILLIIRVDEGKVLVMDSKRKDPKTWADLIEMFQRVWKRFIKEVRGEWKEELRFQTLRCLKQEMGNNLCGYYVCEFIRQTTCEQGRDAKQLAIERMREELLPKDRVRAIQEELAGFFLREVIAETGEYHRRYVFRC